MKRKKTKPKSEPVETEKEPTAESGFKNFMGKVKNVFRGKESK